MPSISEPFGIVALEALSHRVPIIISKQSGVCEIINHCLTVDFWDTDELANKIIGVIRSKNLQDALSKKGYSDLKNCTWNKTAESCLKVYDNLVYGYS